GIRAATEERRRRRDGTAKDRADYRRLLLGHKDSLDSGQRRGCAGTRRSRQTGLWAHRYVAYLETDRWTAACHRRQQCLADHALQYSDFEMGRGPAAAFQCTGQRAARSSRLERSARQNEQLTWYR